jgi:hypothetical protein
MESLLTLAVREAATSARPAALARLEDLLRSGAAVGPDEEPAIVEAVYRRHADKVLPLLVKYGADPGQRRSDGLSVLEILARRRATAAAIDVLLHHGAVAERTGVHISLLSPGNYLVRGDEFFFTWLGRIIKSATTCLADANPDWEFDPWLEIEGEELLHRLLTRLVPSPCPPDGMQVLVLGDEDLCCIKGAFHFCGECVLRRAGIDQGVLDGVEQDLRLLAPTVGGGVGGDPVEGVCRDSAADSP